MRSRRIVVICLGLVALVVAPQSAEPVQDDEVSMKQKVKPYIENGVEYIRRVQHSNGTWAWKNNDPSTPETVGATALCAIALMENNVPVSDKAVQSAASIVRRGAGNYNYGTCLCVLFLDRLHKSNQRLNKDGIAGHGDASLVLSLAHKIVGGQGKDGGWGYFYPPSNPDNSNTQFAVVALWVARKYERPGGRIDKALKAAENKFRSSQHASGAWAYDQPGTPLQPTPSMTCAGILGLALGAGTDRRLQEAKFRGAGASGSGSLDDPYQKLDVDPQVAKARKALAGDLPMLTKDNAPLEHSTYTLWSLERVCKLYRWKKLEGLDWFAMGANWLMRKQGRNGGWALDNMMSNANVDTAFALLFLGQSNLLGDLSTAEFTGKDPNLGTVIVPKKKPVEETKIDPAVDSAALVAKLLEAPPGPQREKILDEFEERRGSEYTFALAGAIDKLSSPDAKETARVTLRKRLQRLKKESLGQYTVPDEANTREIRLAAAAAAKYKNDPEYVELVIPMLADEDKLVREQAQDSLKSLTGVDLGPSTERWRRWLEESKKANKKDGD